MTALVLGKIVSASFTISSGGSGGVFAPSLFIGSMLGGFYGSSCGRIFQHIVTEPAACVLIGMGGFFAGFAKPLSERLCGRKPVKSDQKRIIS